MPPFKTSLLLVALFLTTLCSGDLRRQMLKEERAQRRLARHAARARREQQSGQTAHRNFYSDADVDMYLRMFAKDAMIWNCKNAVTPPWDGHPLPLIELDCQTLGVLESADWYQDGRRIPTHDRRFKQTVVPHFASRTYFSKWLDFKLRIYNATIADSGVYLFVAKTITGEYLEQKIYVDISRKRTRRTI